MSANNEGSSIGRYDVVATIGAGATADVFLARHRELGTRHVLKVLREKNRRAAARARQEGRLQARLNDPGIVRIHDLLHLDDGRIALVMDYVPGPSLEAWLQQRSLTIAQVDHLARELMRALAYAHDTGLVHRDIKPANILLDRRDDALYPVLTDFGIAKLVDPEPGLGLTRSGVTMGTPRYMAPEQFKSARRVDQRADIFSLGAVLYRMIAGQPPFLGQGILEVYEAVSRGRYIPLPELCPGTPARMVHAINKALKTDPDDRPSDCRELLELWAGSPQAAAAEVKVSPDLWPEPAGRSESLRIPQDVSEVLPTQVDPSLARVSLTERSMELGTLRATLQWAKAPPRRRWAGAILGAGAALALVGFAVGATTWLTAHGLPTLTSEVPIRATVQDAGPVLIAAAEPEEPAAVEEAPVAQPVSPKKATPRPAGDLVDNRVARRPTPSAPPPDDDLPAPIVIRLTTPTQPAQEPAPVPAVAEVIPPAEEPAPTLATVRVDGETPIRLRDPWGGTLPAGPVPPGTYKVLAWFGEQPLQVAELTLAEGQQVTLHCEPALRLCR
ncbi:MAG: serine/threonine protein kinase [Alphaproteobacteria bacterium]|nr:serine/threonine protein kinase [Alphaproteobacteria bacterium]